MGTSFFINVRSSKMMFLVESLRENLQYCCCSFQVYSVDDIFGRKVVMNYENTEKEEF
jgi:hypothetical protein